MKLVGSYMRLKNRNSQWWLGQVEAWQKSGISQAEYCRLNNLNHKSFSSWKLKQAKQLYKNSNAEIPVFTSSPMAAPLIPVAISEQIVSAAEAEVETPPLSKSGFSGVTLIVKNYYQISLAVDFNPRTLKNVLAVLAE